MKYLRLLWSGLFRRKARTLLTLASIAIAFLLFALLQAVGFAFEAGAEMADANRLLTTSRYSFIEPLPIGHLQKIQSTPGVEKVAHAAWFGAKYQDQSNAFPVFAVSPGEYLDVYPEFEIDPEQRQAWLDTRIGAVAGQRLIDRFGWQIGQQLPISSEIFPNVSGDLAWEFKLVGALDASDPAAQANTDVVLIHWDYFDEAKDPNYGRGTTGWYIVRVSDADQAKDVSETIDARFMNSPDETKTQPEKEFAKGFAQQIGDIGGIVMRILAAVFFTILVLTANTMVRAIRERIPEFAILKTLGFSDGKVSALVLAESLLLLLIGGLVGIGLGALLLPGVNSALGGQFPPMSIGGGVWLVGIAIMVGIGLLIGLNPALKVRRMKIVDALSGHQ